ncbi:MAG: glycosyltransferase [Bacilli bacterium]|nr:glycosyltransferase [Bacilli bacterium]
MKKISVIVPVYNVEQYLEKCLTSLINQTLEDIEIIIVNDGSPDNSQQIIDKYVSKYPDKIKSFIKENGGLSDARNYGITKATGEYIAFIDSDDWADVKMFEIMYNKAISNYFDIVVCNVEYVYENDSKLVDSNVKKDIYDKKAIKKIMTKIYPSAWNKIYHKNLFLNNVFFKKGVWFEDVEFMYRLLPYVNSIGQVDGYFVKYLQRSNSITSTFDNRIFNYIDNWNGIIDYYKQNGLYNEYKQVLEYSYVRYLYATFIKSALKFKNKKFYQEAVEQAILNVKRNFSHYYYNTYFYTSGLKGIYLLLFSKSFSKLLWIVSNKQRKGDL